MSRPSLTAEKALWGWAVTRKFIKANIEVANINAELEAERDALREALEQIQTGDCDYPEQVARRALEAIEK